MKFRFVGVSLANFSTNGIFHKFNLLVGDIEKEKICFQIPGTFAMFGRLATADKTKTLTDRNILGLGVYAENIFPSTPEGQIFIGK